MRGIARLNDSTFGTCKHPSHSSPIQVSGKIVSGSGTINVNNRPTARLDDVVRTSCGHYDYISTASGTVTGDPKPVARLNDSIGKNNIYIAKIITASGDTFTS
jgi:uncharacterized Zn-binding protein involved in type VI secretion